MSCKCRKTTKSKTVRLKKINLSEIRVPRKRKVRSTELSETFDFSGNCGQLLILARTNGLSAEFNTIRNVGNCAFTLLAVDRNGNVIQNSEYTLQ